MSVDTLLSKGPQFLLWGFILIATPSGGCVSVQPSHLSSGHLSANGVQHHSSGQMLPSSSDPLQSTCGSHCPSSGCLRPGCGHLGGGNGLFPSKTSELNEAPWPKFHPVPSRPVFARQSDEEEFEVESGRRLHLR